MHNAAKAGAWGSFDSYHQANVVGTRNVIEACRAHAIGQGHVHTAGIAVFLRHPGFPVDIRHNAKIGREKLAAWAAQRKD